MLSNGSHALAGAGPSATGEASRKTVSGGNQRRSGSFALPSAMEETRDCPRLGRTETVTRQTVIDPLLPIVL